MSLEPNHYEALGLPSTASADQIKKKYRELARRYHPDVNASPDAVHRILSINQAYQILGDPQRRAAYDAERAIQEAVRPGRPAAPPSTPPRPRQPAAQPPNSRAGVYYDGFGRAYTPPRPERRSAPPKSTPQPKRGPDAQAAGTGQMLTEAKLAFINRQFRQAQRLCQEVLAINPREAIAHEILGDIFVRQGETQRASASFAYAIQFNPRNQSAQAKLERLMHVSSSRQADRGPSITYTRGSGQGHVAGPTSDANLAILSLLSGALLVAAPLLLAMNPGKLADNGSGGPFGLSWNLLAALVVAGSASGVLLALYGRMRPFTQEVWDRTRPNGMPSTVPLGAVLGLFAIIWFYGSFLVYIGISATRNRFSPSILRAYAVTLGLVVLFTLAYHPISTANVSLAAPLLAGNLLFPAVLFGWRLGDAFRLRGRL